MKKLTVALLASALSLPVLAVASQGQPQEPAKQEKTKKKKKTTKKKTEEQKKEETKTP
jgi:uncharacterized low-complexity protein